MTPKSTSINYLVTLLKFAIPISIPIFYMQGYAYYSGALSPYKINASLYPLPVEQTLAHAYFFYTNIVSYINFIFIGICLIFLISLFLSIINKRKKRKEERKFKNWEKCVNDFLDAHEKSFLVLFVPLLILCVYLLSLFVVLEPYNLGKKIAQTSIEKGEYTKNQSLIEIKKGPESLIMEGYIVQNSEKLITFIDQDKNVRTIPMSEVILITSNL